MTLTLTVCREPVGAFLNRAFFLALNEKGDAKIEPTTTIKMMPASN